MKVNKKVRGCAIKHFLTGNEPSVLFREAVEKERDVNRSGS